MLSLRKIVWISFFSIIALFITYLIVSYFRSFSEKPARPLDAVDQNAVFFIEVNDTRDLLNVLTGGPNTLRSALQEIHEVKEVFDLIHDYDSLALIDYRINEWLSLQQMILSFNLSENQQIFPVLIFQLPEGENEKDLSGFFRRANGEQSIIMQKKYRATGYSLLNLTRPGKLVYYTVYRGLLMVSFNEEGLIRSIDRVDKGHPPDRDESFKQLRMTAGKKVDANIYFNYKRFAELVPAIIECSKTGPNKYISDFATWTEADLNILDRELLFNGYTITGDTDYCLLDRFKSKPQPVSVAEILPYHTGWLFDLSSEDLRKSLMNIQESRLSSYKKEYHIDLVKDFLSWTGNEITLAGSSMTGDSIGGLLLVIKSPDVLKAGLKLESIRTAVNQIHGGGSISTMKYNGYQISKIDLPGLLPDVFGPLFSGLHGNYFLTIKDYVVFANTPELLMDLINNFYSGQVLANNMQYQSFSNNIADQSNIYFYCNLHKSLDYFLPFFTSETKKEISLYSPLLKRFEGISLQFSYVNRMFFTSLYLKYNPDYHEIDPTRWKFELDNEVRGQPYLVRNHRDGRLNIIAFDKMNTMYLADHHGKIQWKLPLVEPPLSDIHLVDYYKNGKWQYLFNTRNYLYLVDLNGDYVADYPIKLPAPATRSLAVFDFNNDKDYRLILPLEDHRVYNFDIQGKEVEGWNKITTKADVVTEVRHLKIDHKDYIFITDVNGHLIITGRDGVERIKIKKPFLKARNSKCYVNSTNSKGLFLTTDRRGKLVYIDQRGNISRTSFGDFSENHYFYYTDFDGNRSKDFIYVDGNRLLVFDRFKNPILDYELPEPVLTEPHIFFLNEKLCLALVLLQRKEVLMFDASGRIYTEKYITGETPMVTGSLSGNDKTNLLIGSGNEIVNYLLD